MINSYFKRLAKRILDKFEINFVRNPHSALGLTPKKELRHYLDNFRPIDNGIPLIRIGDAGDGGYLVPDDLDGIEACFSPESDMLWTFESQLAINYGIKSYICDKDERRPKNLTKDQHFTPGWLGIETIDNYISLTDWISVSNLQESSDLLLQMDIERAEWTVLFALSTNTLLRFRVIVVEFHFLSQLRNNLAFEKLFKPALDKLFANFDVVHSHPNNCCGTFPVDGIDFPEIIEITFHRKDRAKARAGFRELPNKLDSRCVPTAKELFFNWKN